MNKKKILLAVCGSISFYKAFELLSMLKKRDFDVYVMLSEGALRFVDYAAFDALCDHPVLCSKTENWQEGLNHIQYAKVDLILIAPASVNTINKLGWGVCDNVFMQTLIASSAPILIAPAANEKMLDNPITINSMDILTQIRNAKFIEPVKKTLACGELGKGGLADLDSIIYEVYRTLYSTKAFADKMVVITGGPTIEKIDDVRALTNFSSGKMAKALADAYYYLGADVTFITSIDFNVPYKMVKFETSIGLKSALDSMKFKKKSLLIMAAAVSDYVPRVRIKGKAKKEEMGEIWSLRLGLNQDIISEVKDKNVKKIAFKLETDHIESIVNARNMLKDKNLDAVCLNVLDDIVKFGSDDTRITYITKSGYEKLKTAPKTEIAMQIALLSKSLIDE